VASNLTKRLDKIERLIRERKLLDTSPLYLRDGDQMIPEGIDPERVVWIKRTFIDPPERADGDDELPVAEPQTASRESPPTRREPIEYPDLGIA
jgi:hypothetical protein